MGKNKECAYTWDMQSNTNLAFPSGRFLPHCRFDRLYFRPAISSTIKFKSISFNLEGLEMIPSIDRFCSDHWAIQVEFQF
jgi:tyrosyl-DNA phosphodiesterase 2